MAVLAVTYTLSNGQTSDATLWNTNYSDIVTWLNNRYNGTDTWTAVKAANLTASAQFLGPAGTQSAPSFSFTSSPNLGIYNSAANTINFATNGTARVSLDTTSLTSNLPIYLSNGTAGNPSVAFAVSTGIYSAGTNSLNFTTGGTARMSIDATTISVNIPFNPVGAGTVSSGDGTNYWNDISYKTLTDRGCLPWCDNGVELADGSIVSDLESLANIQKDPKKITIQGLPMLDYKTFPKKAYVQARNIDGVLPRDSNDEPIGGSDGVEMTMIFGVMIGAFKELKSRVEALEKNG